MSEIVSHHPKADGLNPLATQAHIFEGQSENAHCVYMKLIYKSRNES